MSHINKNLIWTWGSSHGLTVGQRFISSPVIKCEGKKKKKSQNCEDLESSVFHALFCGKLLQEVLQQNKEVSQVAIHKLATLTQKNRDRQKSLGWQQYGRPRCGQVQIGTGGEKTFKTEGLRRQRPIHSVEKMLWWRVWDIFKNMIMENTMKIFKK